MNNILKLVRPEAPRKRDLYLEQIRVMKNDLKWMRDDLRVIAEYFEREESIINCALWDAEKNMKKTINRLEEVLND